jgi:hypothetical protein
VAAKAQKAVKAMNEAMELRQTCGGCVCIPVWMYEYALHSPLANYELVCCDGQVSDKSVFTSSAVDRW